MTVLLKTRRGHFSSPYPLNLPPRGILEGCDLLRYPRLFWGDGFVEDAKGAFFFTSAAQPAPSEIPGGCNLLRYLPTFPG